MVNTARATVIGVWTFATVLVISVTLFQCVDGHGGILEPPSRSLAWRYGFDAPINYDWMSLYCGGFHVSR